MSDGIFSMRGDFVPLHEVTAICHQYEEHFAEGIVTIIDDSHGIGAFGQSGRGVEEFTGSRSDILVATLGKALGVNGGYVVADKSIIDYLLETAPFYVYPNPITPSEAAAALQALDLLDGPIVVYDFEHLGFFLQAIYVFFPFLDKFRKVLVQQTFQGRLFFMIKYFFNLS